MINTCCIFKGSAISSEPISFFIDFIDFYFPKTINRLLNFSTAQKKKLKNNINQHW